ncbi:glycosyltransferase family 2 protein [Sphingomonas sp. SRS2]|uniref:glycosyltransferase family 2 protein n=1 Tax=Sphingomonas sp. SRS2 TaxID=133190 RepID=UPI0006184B5F|nr:glycosyltransferase family 2 protein [Sphingomonas sp. SRS2]KKC27760.1 glycosyl transferase [Sphingomonas sp. SRS2]
MRSVSAVVLTYNRRDLVEDCLRAIGAQSHPVDRIVVIDNGSTDGTADMLARNWSDKIELHILPKNLGAAGGFNAGIRMAYRSQADAIWVMDDDVMPDPDALERLIDADALLRARHLDPPFVISTARTPGGIVTNVPDIDLARNSLSYQNWPELLEHCLVPVRRATFVSILLPRATLDEFGLPIASMFIWGEDTEYTARITRERAGYLVGNSRAVHVRQLDGKLDIRTETNPTRIGYHYYFLRNQAYNVRHYQSAGAFIRHLFRQAKIAGKLLLTGQFRKAKIVATGTMSGIIFRPTIEAADAPIDTSGWQSFMMMTEQIITTAAA